MCTHTSARLTSMLFTWCFMWVLESPLSKLHHQRICETNNMASLSRSACFSWQSGCRSGFSCILDNSETFPCTVIKDEFPGPVEKTPQFSSGRLDFIMRWKDTSAAGKKKIHGPCYSQRLSSIICFSVAAHREREAAVGFQTFPAPSRVSEQTTVKKWKELFKERGSQWPRGTFSHEAEGDANICPVHCLPTACFKEPKLQPRPTQGWRVEKLTLACPVLR